jgi:hypothetical protein
MATIDIADLPATVTFNNVGTTPLGVLNRLLPTGAQTITLTGMEDPYKAQLWMALRNAKTKGYITSASLADDVVDPMTSGHQGVANRGGQDLQATAIAE